jgi:hypothetical protein
MKKIVFVILLLTTFAQARRKKEGEDAVSVGDYSEEGLSGDYNSEDYDSDEESSGDYSEEYDSDEDTEESGGDYSEEDDYWNLIRITGGAKVKPISVPSYVALQIFFDRGTKTCGGFLGPAADQIVTAASCVFE